MNLFVAYIANVGINYELEIINKEYFKKHVEEHKSATSDELQATSFKLRMKNLIMKWNVGIELYILKLWRWSVGLASPRWLLAMACR